MGGGSWQCAGSAAVPPCRLPLTLRRARRPLLLGARTQVQKYFVSGGFAFVHPDSTADVCAVEAVALNDLDEEAVRAGLQVSLSTPCGSSTSVPRSSYGDP